MTDDRPTFPPQMTKLTAAIRQKYPMPRAEASWLTYKPVPTPWRIRARLWIKRAWARLTGRRVAP